MRVRSIMRVYSIMRVCSILAVGAVIKGISRHLRLFIAYFVEKEELMSRLIDDTLGSWERKKSGVSP